MKPVLLCLCILLSLSFYKAPKAEVRNNNHIFEVAELSIIKLRLLAEYAGKVLPSIRAPFFEHKRPMHLMARIIDAHTLVRRLQTQSGLIAMPARQLPDRSVGAEDIYDLLEVINEGLDVLLEQKNLERPLGPESLYGKSMDDNYARLWYLNRLLEAMVESPDKKIILTHLRSIRQSLDHLPQSQGSSQADNYPERQAEQAADIQDVLSVCLQIQHLLARFQHQNAIEVYRPDQLPHPDAGIGDLYDMVRETVADLHRTRIVLEAVVTTQMPTVTQPVDYSMLYRDATEIRERLLSITGSAAL